MAVLIYVKGYKIIMLRFDSFPLFPKAHPYPHSQPHIQRFSNSAHIRNSEVIHPSCYVPSSVSITTPLIITPDCKYFLIKDNIFGSLVVPDSSRISLYCCSQGFFHFSLVCSSCSSVGILPPASFRFHLTVDTFAFDIHTTKPNVGLLPPSYHTYPSH